MEKDLKISLLLDYYSAFLTKNQKEILELYYNQDYSLGEIAENKNITRQAALDTVTRGVLRLKGMEDELKLAGNYMSVTKSLKKCESLAKNLLNELDGALNIWEERNGV